MGGLGRVGVVTPLGLLERSGEMKGKLGLAPLRRLDQGA
jgi:hypothetical protein